MSATPTTALARTPQQPAPLAVFSRTERDPGAITTMLKRAAQEFHLISPATACGALPEGFSVAFSSVLVDPDKDTYDTKGGGKRGLHRHVLDRIAAAAAVSWDPRESRRLDDGKDPHYCSFQAVGRYKHFDGREVVCVGTKEMDLRDGSQQIAGKSEKEIAMQRTHIVAHAETKARCRAIAAMGIKRSFTADELKKPFVVARLMFTGQTEDQGLRRDFALMQAAAMLGMGSAPRFVDSPAPPAALPARLPAPPVGTTAPDADFEELPPAGPATSAPPSERAPEPASTVEPPSGEARAASGLTIPGGQSKGTPIEDADDQDLEYWAARLEKALADGSARPQYADRDRALAAAMRAEQARRDSDR